MNNIRVQVCWWWSLNVDREAEPKNNCNQSIGPKPAWEHDDPL